MIEDTTVHPDTLARLQQQIAEAQRRLELTLDAAGVTGAWDWDIARKIFTADASFAALTGQDALALSTGMPTGRFFANIHQDDTKRIRLAVAAMLSGAEVFDKDYRLRRADGGLRWVHAKGRTLFNDRDEPVRFVGDLVDITEQKRVQEQLRIAQTAGGIGTFEHAEGFGTVQVSAQFCHLFGLHPTKVLPLTTINGLIDAGDPRIIDSREVEEGAGSRQFEFRIARADNGERRWLARRGEYVPNLEGPGVRYIGVVYDITDTKRIEERLKQANEGLSERVRERTQDLNRIWRNSRDLLAILDSNGVVRDVNPVWSETLGVAEARVNGRRLQDFLAANAGNLPDLTQGNHSFEARMRHADGSERIIAWTSHRDGSSVYAYGRDVTVEREQAAALADTEARLRQSQKMEAVGQLTGGIAHDFNNMLTGIMGAIDIVKRRIASNRLDDVNRFMDAATISAQRAASLTHRLLAFSRRQSLDRRPINIGELVHGMSDLLDRSLGEQVKLSVDIENAWPIVTDPNQLENAILNLAINARDAMPDGGVLTISTRNLTLDDGGMQGLSLDGPRDFVVIEVADTGEGMPADVIEKAFDPFFTTKPIGQGTGLGLSMVYGFAQQSGGAAAIASLPGQGTTISLYLPRGDAEEVAEGVAAFAAVPLGMGERVLVVEDDASVRLLVVEVLRDLGYVPLEAVDADSAIDILKTTPQIDLLISDVGLPGLNGRQLAEIAGGIIPDLKILFMTGYAAGATDRAEFLGENMEMISKPFDLERLGHKIRSMLA